jgi:hypothetical protein
MLIVGLSFFGDKTEKRACIAQSAEKLWTITFTGITETSWKYSGPTVRPLSGKRGGNILLAVPSRMGLFSSALATYSVKIISAVSASSRSPLEAGIASGGDAMSLHKAARLC